MKRILIIRPSAIGDIVMASPMIYILRRAFPNARIAWLVEPHLTDLLQHDAALDEVICWSKSRWTNLLKKGQLLQLLREILKFRQDMLKRRFDLTLDAQGLFRSRLLAWLSGATQRIGFDSKEPGRFLMTRIVSRGPSNKRMGSEYIHLMREIGIFDLDFDPYIETGSRNCRSAQEKLKSDGVTAPYAVICPFTTRPQKHWFSEKWSQLIRRLTKEFRLPVVILGGPSDRTAAQTLCEITGNAVTDLTGQLTLGQSAAVIRQAALVIGVDTGLTHLGTAFKRPTVALFGSTCPYLHTVSHLTTVIFNPHDCSPCKRSPTCSGTFSCMQSISVDQVCRAAGKRLVEAGEPS